MIYSIGTASIIYRGDQGDFGTLYKIVPVTTNNTYNVITCFAVPGAKEQPVVPQVVLPDPKDYVVSAWDGWVQRSCMHASAILGVAH